MGSCYADKFVEICKSQWNYQCGPNKWNIYADDLDKVDYFTGCGKKQNLDFCAVGLCWAMWKSVIDPSADTDGIGAKWSAHYFMYQSDTCNTSAVVKYLYQFFADNNAVTDNPERGDIVIFQKAGNGGSKILYHCGAVTNWNWDNDSIEVTEFNTGGGQVLPRYYSFKDIGNKIKCFCRPRYDGWSMPINKYQFDNSICAKCVGIEVTVNTDIDPLSLRVGPDINSTRICGMPKGSKVNYKGEYIGNWAKVNYKDMSGFCDKRYLKI